LQKASIAVPVNQYSGRKEQIMKQYAYVRISTVQQNTDRQTMALGGFDIPENRIFTDKQSGKDFNRPAYKKLLRKPFIDRTYIPARKK
jgi:hypothetical protein